MNAKELIGKKIIDKKARDLAKLVEITFSTETFTISKIFGSIGNPISKKYYEIPSNSILAVGDYIQIGETIEDIGGKVLEKIPETEENFVNTNDLLGKTILTTEGNIVGKVSNIDIDLEKFEITEINISGSSSSFGKPKDNFTVNQSDIKSIGDYIIVEKVDEKSEEKEETKESKENKNSVKIDIE